MIINVSAFGAKLPNKIAISNTFPDGVKPIGMLGSLIGPQCDIFELLVPKKKIWLEYKAGDIDWQTFSEEYLNQIAFLSFSKIASAIEVSMNIQEITFCCWEAAADEHCHRKLLYDSLPEKLKGARR